jgi:hypothetical protein
MKDLCVPIPNFGEDEIADIELRVGDQKISYSFRVESFAWQKMGTDPDLYPQR